MDKSQIKRLDAIFAAKYTGPGLCEWCGKFGVLEPHHINYRRYLNTRWDKTNIMMLDRECHRKAHDKVIKFQEFALNKLGRKHFFELQQKAFNKFHRELNFDELVIKL